MVVVEVLNCVLLKYDIQARLSNDFEEMSEWR